MQFFQEKKVLLFKCMNANRLLTKKKYKKVCIVTTDQILVVVLKY